MLEFIAAGLMAMGHCCDRHMESQVIPSVVNNNISCASAVSSKGNFIKDLVSEVRSLDGYDSDTDIDIHVRVRTESHTHIDTHNLAHLAKISGCKDLVEEKN